MNLQEYRQMYQMESSHWYFVGKVRMIRRIISRLTLPSGCSLLDVGCGTGNILKMLSQFGEVTGVDSSPVALEFCRQRGLKNLHPGDMSELHFPDGSFDVVCAFDVLEHVDDDLGALEEMGRVCKPGGFVVITVPALRLLWSEHDEALHHKRRYTKREVEHLVRAAGMRVKKLSYANTLLFLPALAYRLTKRLRRSDEYQPRSEFFVALPQWVNKTLLGIFTLEGKFLPWVNFPIGISVLGVCEKTNQELR